MVDRTTLVIAHRLSTIRAADLILISMRARVSKAFPLPNCGAARVLCAVRRTTDSSSTTRASVGRLQAALWFSYVGTNRRYVISEGAPSRFGGPQ